jgi:hypothetical protein
MNEYKVSERKHPIGNGVQKIYRFPNGYGASVVRFMIPLYDGRLIGGSYGSDDGLWELAVIQWDEDKYKVVYTTPVTGDVLGNLNDADVQETLKQIMELE